MPLPVKYNIRNLFVRKISTGMTILSIALVVAVFLTIMSLASGMTKTFTSSGESRNVLAIRKSAQVEGNSTVTRAEHQIVRYLPGIATGLNGQPLISAEMITLLNLPRRTQEGSSNVMIRGVEPQGFELRPQLRISQGRMFRPGFREMIVSRNIAGRFKDTDVGKQMKFGKGMWTIVGHFEAGGTAFDSEMWADVNELAREFGREGFSSLLMRSRDAQSRNEIIQQINSDRRLHLEALSESEYYEKQTFAAVGLQILATFMTIFMGIGACFAAMITMYTAVSNRTREIGAMRALGFSRGSILSSFLIEAILLALIGGGVGCLLALPVNGMSTGTSNFNTFSEITFNFRITFPLVAIALALSGFLGVLGGFWPARRAARQNIVEALRSQ
jgi:putative ABC transport system permease protein